MIQSMKPASIERHQARHAQPRRRQRAGQRQADGDVVGEHLRGEQLARLAQPAGVVGEKRFLDDLLQGKRRR